MIGILIFTGVAAFFSNQAHAYIDPGTGSMIVQGLLAAIAACIVTIGMFWRRLKDLWGRLLGRNRDE